MPIIYVATNTKNGKRYLGATVRVFKQRQREHILDATNGRGFCRAFNAAIRKYGVAAFEWRIIATCDTREELMREEIRLIAEMKPEYNITLGGQGIIGVPRTPEWLAKMSSSQKGRKLSPERRAQTVAFLRPEMHHKSVVCLNDGRFFESVKATARHYGLTPKNIGEVTSGRQLESGGLSFVLSKVPLSLEQRNKELAALQARRDREFKRRQAGLRNRSVICTTTNKVFPSVISAARECGLSHSRVIQLCSAGGKTTSGLAFMYADASAPPKKKRRTKEQMAAANSGRLAALQRGQKKIKKRVVCVDTGQLFESISDAARSCGAHVSSVSDAIYRNGRANGLTFRFARKHR